ncbi:MAG: DUF493 domain-containing protein [Pseudomonadales bacterium]|jgi:uncharacterized protein|nr:DUF493 domain-containing protein [Pseudomonadales bacterium]MDP4639869.1 DUF493 domain-containing protein [Pseudomonadales bacterium]MDP4765112.1 DUF493 domain-containing protein [Pseudomonadales bacterium]MDP4874803.1 DUF493 domain-containing protein [Pseudomonadales bacterium]MDP4910561.1 DUF493 domain-containing protein [Pseudomonadales bacterium]
MPDESMSAPVIVFPCDYPIKVVADTHPELVSRVVAVMQRYDAAVSAARLTQRPSRKGNYTALTVSFRATGEPQLKAMFEELKTHAWVRLVL